ncbi:hypothetical protein FPV67DRAFT_592430 [Lyophyllum atratum]|nr:hypothetical protein FPV67DRAFT_592430 [Lyophyllum atratum]
MASESKTAEFARLFDLFERLASRKSRTCPEDDHLDDIRSMPLPPDLAPVINSLASLVGARRNEGEINHKTKTGGRARRNTVTALSRNTNDMDSSNDDDDDESLASFPLGKKYPFTFKLMLHKLYQLDDWAQKVKEVLARSQIEYKPLAEREAEDEARVGKEQEEKKQEGRVHFKAGTAAGSRRPSVRPRSHSVFAPVKGRDGVSLTPALKSPRLRVTVEEDVRAVKKRCVGRSRSFSGPMTGEIGRIGGGWVYDATVSSAESTGRGEVSEFKASGGGLPMLKYPSLGAMPTRVGTKRRVSLCTPAATAPQHLESGIATRRRALSVMNNLTPVQAQRKRPLEF